MDTIHQNVTRAPRRALKSSDEGEELEILIRYAARVKKRLGTTSYAVAVKACRAEECP